MGPNQYMFIHHKLSGCQFHACPVKIYIVMNEWCYKQFFHERSLHETENIYDCMSINGSYSEFIGIYLKIIQL